MARTGGQSRRAARQKGTRSSAQHSSGKQSRARAASWRLWGKLAVAVLAIAVTALAITLGNSSGGAGTAGQIPDRRVVPDEAPKPNSALDLSAFEAMTAEDLIALSDDELDAMDPLIMNMIVARGLPELTELEFERYVETVDHWASIIARGLAAQQADGLHLDEATWQADPNIWRAGGMAIAVGGRAIGISYTRSVEGDDHADLFVPGMIDERAGTCSNLPVLYMAIGHRLGWPIRAVVTADHMWTRWDEGEPGPEDGGSYFNLEATATEVDGGEGSFATPPDSSYIEDFEVSWQSIEMGSDMTTLTARQTLGVYLQQRASYWAFHEDTQKVRADLELALQCFPENVDIRMTMGQLLWNLNQMVQSGAEPNGPPAPTEPADD